MTNATDALLALPDQWDEFAAKCIEPAAAHAIKTCASELRLRLATPAGSASGEDKAIANVRVLKDGRWFWSPRIGKPLKDLPEGDHELVLASDYAALQAEVAQLQAALAEARRDAERYLWLVENAVIETDAWRHDGRDAASTKQPLDKAIDAALHQRKENGHAG